MDTCVCDWAAIAFMHQTTLACYRLSSPRCWMNLEAVAAHAQFRTWLHWGRQLRTMPSYCWCAINNWWLAWTPTLLRVSGDRVPRGRWFKKFTAYNQERCSKTGSECKMPTFNVCFSKPGNGLKLGRLRWRWSGINRWKTWTFLCSCLIQTDRKNILVLD